MRGGVITATHVSRSESVTIKIPHSLVALNALKKIWWNDYEFWVKQSGVVLRTCELSQVSMYQLKYFYKSQQDTCTWKHSSLFTMLYYCAWFQIFEFVDHKFSWIRFFCLRLLSTNSRISVYHVTNVNLINPRKLMPTNENETPVSGSRSTDRICSVSAAPPPPSAAVVLPGVLWSIHGARSDQKSTIVCPPPTYKRNRHVQWQEVLLARGSSLRQKVRDKIPSGLVLYIS